MVNMIHHVVKVKLDKVEKDLCIIKQLTQIFLLKMFQGHIY